MKYLVQIADLSDILCKSSFTSCSIRNCIQSSSSFHIRTNEKPVSGTNSLTWSVVEPGTAITAASLVTIRPLLRAFNISGFKSSNATSSRPTQVQNISLRSGIQSEVGNAQSSGNSQHQSSQWPSVQALKRTTAVHNEEVSDGGSEEYILEGIGTARTVDITDFGASGTGIQHSQP